MKKALIFCALFAAHTAYAAPEPAVKDFTKQSEAYRESQKNKIEAFRQAQQKDNEAFRATLDAVKPEERPKLMADRRAKQFAENTRFRDQIQNENLTFLKAKMAEDKNLTEAQKAEFLSFWQERYKKDAEFQDTQHREAMAFLEKVTADTTLNDKQKKDTIRKHMEAQKAARVEYRKAQTAALKTAKKKKA